jgi:hypothetical protein
MNQQRAPSLPARLPVKIDRISLDNNRSIYVLRDDLLPAGTKQRAVTPFLRQMHNQGIRQVVYASPFAGFAQVALAVGCQEIGLACHLFCERDPSRPGLTAHRFTELARENGALISLTESLEEAEIGARDFALSTQAQKIPLGFQSHEFEELFQSVVREVLSAAHGLIGHPPNHTWLPVGSGTLTRAFRRAAPGMKLCCVDVHVLPPNDLRLQALRSLPGIRHYSAPLRFQDPADHLPPVPSNLHYDAKLWALLEAEAEDGDLWWNVAR